VAIRERRLELGGYNTRALEIDGNGEGAPLVLLHGWSDSADTWRLLLAALRRRGRRAIALDMPGFGTAAHLSDRELVLPQLDRFVAAAVSAQSERHGERVVVVGNSLGGCAAMRAAENADLRVAGIVPIAPAGLAMARWFRIIEGERLLRLVLASPVPLPETAVRNAVGRVYRALAFANPRTVDGAAVASFTRHLRSQRDLSRALATGRRLLPELADPFDLGHVKCPVLMVWGDRDRMVYATGADRVLREVKDSKIHVIEHCGHCPQIEAVDTLTALLDRFPSPRVAALA
jgi:pimeloyl-ACP methyl ester carboxylesterase